MKIIVKLFGWIPLIGPSIKVAYITRRAYEVFHQVKVDPQRLGLQGLPLESYANELALEAYDEILSPEVEELGLPGFVSRQVSAKAVAIIATKIRERYQNQVISEQSSNATAMKPKLNLEKRPIESKAGKKETFFQDRVLPNIEQLKSPIKSQVDAAKSVISNSLNALPNLQEKVIPQFDQLKKPVQSQVDAAKTAISNSLNVIPSLQDKVLPGVKSLKGTIENQIDVSQSLLNRGSGRLMKRILVWVAILSLAILLSWMIGDLEPEDLFDFRSSDMMGYMIVLANLVLAAFVDILIHSRPGNITIYNLNFNRVVVWAIGIISAFLLAWMIGDLEPDDLFEFRNSDNLGYLIFFVTLIMLAVIDRLIRARMISKL